MKPVVEAFFDSNTYTYSYVVSDPASGACAIIDSLLDYDPASGHISTASAQRIIDYIVRQGLSTQWILDTHIHADHLSAARYLQRQLGGKTAIGSQVKQVQQTFREVFNLESEFPADGHQFDRLLNADSTLRVGNLECRVLATPGHTPACVTYLFPGMAFVGDTLFMPDYGTARTDFPGGDAATLYCSIQRILELPDDTILFLCHDYGTAQRTTFCYHTTVAEERANNIHLSGGGGIQDFVEMRSARDSELRAPALLLPSVQFNIRAGALPPAEANGTRYFKIPIKTGALEDLN